MFLPKLVKLLSGPAVIALLPEGDSMVLTVYAVTPNADAARELETMWPAPASDAKPDDPGAYLKLVRLKTLQPEELPSEDAPLPDWATSDKWPAGDIAIVAQPRKFAKAAEKAIVDGKVPGIAPNSPIIPTLADIDDAMIERSNFGLAIDGQLFVEDLTIELSHEKETTLTRVANILKEKPKSWDSMLRAMPGDGEAAVMAQTDLKALGADLPFAVQTMERFLRGKRWARKTGITPEALDPKRFDFLFERLHGEIGISARPALTRSASGGCDGNEGLRPGRAAKRPGRRTGHAGRRVRHIGQRAEDR